eukprot:Em0006g1145a
MATRLLLFCVLLVQARTISTLTFRDSPANSTVLSTLAAGTTLHCSATAPAPPFLISWKHNDAYVDSSGRTSTRYNQTTGQSAYTISGGVTYSDAGAYQCVAFDAQGNTLAISSIGFLTVVGPPLLLSTLFDLVVPLGGYAIFTAPSVISNPPYSSTAWYNGTAAVQRSGRVTTTSSALTISSVQATDAGIYKYTVANSYGTTNAYGSLAIGPSADSMVRIQVGLNRTAATNYLLKEGDQLTLLCSYSPESNLFGAAWTKDLAALTSHLTVVPGGISYTLGAVSRSDAGLYVCSAQNQQGGVTQASIMIDVQYAPYFTTIPASRTINSSTILQNMQCQATSNPGPPTIAWWSPSGQVLGVSGGSPVLGPLSGRDSGVYTCVATNAVGISTAGVSVTVLDAPQVTISPPSLAVLQGTDVIFTCIASGSPPVTLVTWMDRFSIIRASNDSELFLPSVASSASGQYSCTATNNYGSQTAFVSLTVLPAAPVITVLPVLTAVQLGQPFTLVCRTLPLPGSSISWTVSGVPIATLDPSAVALSNGSLTIPNAKIIHNGIYTCAFSVGELTFEGSGQVIVGVPPTVLTPPTNINIQPGRSTVLPCNFTGSPTPSVQWTKLTELGQTQVLPLVGATFRVNSEGLLFTSVVREDSGWYAGWIENVFGRAQCNSRLHVAGAPLVLSITPTTIIATHTYTLTCAVAYNYPQARVWWTRSNGVAIPADRSTANGTTLTISPVVPSDEGYYRCNATNTYDSSTFDQFITVLVPPTLTLPTSPAIIILDSDAQLLCVGSGKPLPSVQWIVSNASSFSPDHIEVSGSSPDLSLFIRSVTHMDDGIVYTCSASNVVSSAVGQVAVTVRGAPPTNVSASALTSRFTTISWGQPAYANDLLYYEFYYKALGSAMQPTIYTLSANTSSFNISGLEPGTVYTISVQGMYENAVQGVRVQLQFTTLEEVPSSPPQSVTVTPEVEALSISWEPPPFKYQNGVIIQYNIYYRLLPTTFAQAASFDTQVIQIPAVADTTTYHHLITSLKGGSSYSVKISAATEIGSGPNSTALTAETIEALPLTLILFTTIPGGVFIIALLLIGFSCICSYYRKKVRRSGHHSTLEEEKGTGSEAGDMWSKKKRKDLAGIAEHGAGNGVKDFKSGKKKGRIEISGPIPSVPPRTEEIGPSKLTVMDKSGKVLSWHPRTITAEDMAPPPPPGGTVQFVSHKSLPSTYRTEDKDGDSDSADSFDESSQQQSSQGRYSGIYDVPDVQQRGVAVKPLNPDHHNKGFNPYDETASQCSSSAGSIQLKATNNSFDLLQQSSNENVDGPNTVYSTVSQEHISMKRLQRAKVNQDPKQELQQQLARGNNRPESDPLQEDEVIFREDAAPYADTSGEQGHTPSQGLNHGWELEGKQIDKEVLFRNVGQTKAEKKLLQKQQKEREKALEEQRKEEARRRKERQKILTEARNLSEKERRRQDKEKRAMKMARDLDVMGTPHFDVNVRSRALFDNAAASIF